MRTRVVLVMSAAVMIAATLGPVARARASEPVAPTRWVVTFNPGTTPADRSAALEGTRILDGQAQGDFALVEAASAPTHPAIARVEPPVPVSVAATAAAAPNDPAYPYQWHLHAIQASDAWATSKGAGVTVAVLDTGVAYEDYGVYRRAPDLAGSAFAAGWDFVNGDAHPNDDHGHGTHVAGTIAQSTGNGAGAAGVAPGATLMPVKVLDSDGNGSDWDIAQGLRWAADHGARVANLSIGGASGSTVLSDAVAYAVGKGVMVVASSGNDGGPVSYPAAYPAVLSVGATRLDGARPAYANYGTGLDVVGPGGDLSVDQNGDGYPDGVLQQTFMDGVPDRWCLCFYQGTSMAAPHVSGLAALMLSHAPAATPTQIESAMVASVRDLGTAGWDAASGHGLVQAPAALAAIGAVPAPSPDDGTTDGSTGDGTVAPAPAPTATADNPFTDDDGNAHEAAITQLAIDGLVNGLAPGVYGPALGVTRAQMATFLVRALEFSGVSLPAAGNAFIDDNDNIHEAAIDKLAAAGVVSGVGPAIYAPDAKVTRAQMATFLVRAVALTDDPPALAAATTDHFADDNGNIHELAINLAADLKLASGTAPGSYSPALVVRRDQMASFLVRTLGLLGESGQ